MPIASSEAPTTGTSSLLVGRGRGCGSSVPKPGGFVGLSHNALVTLNKFGGGVLGTIVHCVTKAEDLYLIAFETA